MASNPSGYLFKNSEIKEEFLRPHKPTEAEKAATGVDRFLEKNPFNRIDSSNKIIDDFRMIRRKMTAFVLQSITPAGEEPEKGPKIITLLTVRMDSSVPRQSSLSWF